MKVVKKHKLLLSFILAIMPFYALATEYYVSEITLNPGQQVKVYLPDMYVEAMNNYGGGYPYSWSSDNQNICTATGYKSRTFCNIYAKTVGDTKLHYHGEYYRNGVIYDYDCYWDIKVIAAGNNGDDSDTSDDDIVVPADSWDKSGNYSIDWYNKNEKVFAISTNRQLAGLAYLVNNGIDSFDGKVINITDDISLYGKNWISIGNSDDHIFKGTFNGNGHRIEDVTIGNQENGQKYVGFFGKVKGNVSFSDLTIAGEIKVDNPIGGNNYLGGFIGFIDYPGNWCYIKNIDCQMPISFSRDLSLSENHPSITFGGLIGEGRLADISFCKYTGNIKIHQYPSSASFSSSEVLGGGLIGNSKNCCISYCEARCNDISAVCPNWNRQNSSASMGIIKLGGLCGNVYSWNIKYCLAIANFTVTHHGWPFSNFGHPYVYIGHLIGNIEKETSLYNNVGIVSYIKQTNTANANLRYFAFPDKIKEKEANYCNSDVDVAWGSYYKQSNYTNVTMYKQSEIKKQAFIDELNNYPMLTEGKTIWSLSEDGFPQLKDLHSTTDIAPIIVQKGAQQTIYSIFGVRLKNPQKGLNIINGKKVVVK